MGEWEKGGRLLQAKRQPLQGWGLLGGGISTGFDQRRMCGWLGKPRNQGQDCANDNQPSRQGNRSHRHRTWSEQPDGQCARHQHTVCHPKRPTGQGAEATADRQGLGFARVNGWSLRRRSVGSGAGFRLGCLLRYHRGSDGGGFAARHCLRVHRQSRDAGDHLSFFHQRFQSATQYRTCHTVKLRDSTPRRNWKLFTN